MKTKRIRIKTVVVFIFVQVLLSCSFSVHSDNPPALPHRFYGVVKNLDDHPVANGLVVRARLIDFNNHSSQNFTTTVSGSAYDFDTKISFQDGGGGAIIFFYVNEVNTTQSAVFIPGGNTELNLVYQVYDEGEQTPGGEPGPTGGPTNIVPTAHAGGPYIGYVNATITFNGSTSMDADGSIVGYRWDFTSDGVFDTDWTSTPIATHVYEHAGIYRATLQVKDNRSATDNDTADVTIKALLVIYASTEALNLIQMTFGLHFSVPFYAIDTNGDGMVDSFIDPNNLLTVVHTVRINGSFCFLLSTGQDIIPEFIWDSSANTIQLITFVPVVITETWIDPDAQEVLFVFSIEKSGWVYIQLTDPYPPTLYPNFTFTVQTTEGKSIPSSMVWRENGTICILDDPEVQYILTYRYTILPPVFNPPNGTLLHINTPSITITFFEEVTPIAATLENIDILAQLTTLDHKTIHFSPPAPLFDGTYVLRITVQDADGNTLTSSVTYTISSSKTLATDESWIIILLGVIVLFIVIILIILRLRLII
jgi:hypothetical protein